MHRFTDASFPWADPWFDVWRGTVDLYLLLDIDLPWIDDGTRMFGSATARERFFDLSRAELELRGVRYTVVRGHGPDRLAAALAAIEAMGSGAICP